MEVRFLDDYEEQCRRCKGGCRIEGMSGSIVCTGFNAKTNADRIRSMTDEELAEFLQESSDCPCPGTKLCEGAGADALSCEKVLLKWLKQETADGRA